MDNTKSKILAAATDLFVQKGFSGASISDIAHQAKINQSLIYHHIGNKQALWAEVKKQMIEQSQIAPLVFEEFSNFKEFVAFVIRQRMQLYISDPRIGRLIQWQMLEEEGEKLVGSMAMTPSSWIQVVKEFQKKRMVSQDFPAHHIALFLYSAINGLVLGTHKLFSLDESENHSYIQMIVDCMGQFFEKR
jgi:AcrR family transcriptional regulator